MLAGDIQRQRVHERVSEMARYAMGVSRSRLEGKTRGQALIYVSITAMTLFAFAAVVADGGLLWLNRRDMQNAVDAAALAGAQQLPMDPNAALGARSIACDYAKTKNGVPDMVVDCSNQAPAGNVGCDSNENVDILVCKTHVASDSVRVTARKQFQPLAGLGLGWATIDIKTQATAVVMSASAYCIGPFYQTQDLLEESGVWGTSGVLLNQANMMKGGAKGGNSGNRLALAVGGNGAKNFENNIANPERCAGEDPPLTSGTATTEPGNMAGPFDDGMAKRQAKWGTQNNCPNPDATTYLREDGRLWKYPLGTLNNIELTPRTCYRMVVIPLLEGDSDDFNGRTTANIKAFLAFYIANWCGKSSDPPAKGSGGCAAPAGTTLPQMEKSELWGYFVSISAVDSPDVGPYFEGAPKEVVLTR